MLKKLKVALFIKKLYIKTVQVSIQIYYFKLFQIS